MRFAPLAAALLIGGCGSVPADSGGEQAGRGLEGAATAAGLVAPATNPVGLYASETDRGCIVAQHDGGYRIGLTVNYGPDHSCRASGTARGANALQVDLADDCRFVARFDGDRIVFPAILPTGCDRACTGRASLAAFEAERLSDSAAEAATLTDTANKPLCAT